MKIFVTIILFLSATTVFAQPKKFRWGTDLCLFESTYDAKKHTEAQLNDTRKLFYLNFFPNTIDPTPNTFEKIKELRVETLEAEYATRTTELKSLNIVKTPYWQALRQKHLKSLEQIYQLSKATMLGYENPARLKGVKFAGACVEKYAEPLSKGGDDLIAAWRMLNETTRKQNISPERIKSIFDKQLSSSERIQYAQLEVMTYDWWNCVNARIERESDYPRSEKEFKKLFSKTKTVDCDEP